MVLEFVLQPGVSKLWPTMCFCKVLPDTVMRIPFCAATTGWNS